MSLALPVEMFYNNVDKAHSQQWTYINDELFIPMRPELMSDIGDYVCSADVLINYLLL